MLLLLGCTTPAWHGDRAVLQVPDHVDFGAVPLGSAATANIELVNDGGRAVHLSLDVDGPFAPDREEIDLGAGATVELGLRFSPTGYGSETGSLGVFAADGQSFLISLLASTDPDSDGDGHAAAAAAGEDCDDLDPEVHPGAADTCYDGVDADCAGDDDDDCDQDGFALDDDCDDASAQAFPGAPELEDGADQDCDGRVDEDFVPAGAVVLTEIHADFPAWVELCSASPVELGGWTLADLVLPTLHADGCVVVCEQEGCDAQLSLDLDSTADRLVLAADMEHDVVAWDESWEPGGGRTRSLSGALVDVELNDDPSSWCLGDGTPGEPNPDCD